MFDSANISIFAGSGGQTFAERMCRYMGRKVGNSEVITFSEGNTFVRINESVRDRDVYLVQPIGMHSNNEFAQRCICFRICCHYLNLFDNEIDFVLNLSNIFIIKTLHHTHGFAQHRV